MKKKAKPITRATREQRRSMREFQKWREDHPERTKEALVNMTRRGVNLYQAKQPFNDAWSAFHNAMLKHIRKDKRLAVACAQYILRRNVLLENYELALATVNDYAAKLGPEVSERRTDKKRKSAGGHNRAAKLKAERTLIDFEPYRTEYFKLIQGGMTQRSAAAQIVRAHKLPKACIDTMPRYFRNHP